MMIKFEPSFTQSVSTDSSSNLQAIFILTIIVHDSFVKKVILASSIIIIIILLLEQISLLTMRMHIMRS